MGWRGNLYSFVDSDPPHGSGNIVSDVTFLLPVSILAFWNSNNNSNQLKTNLVLQKLLAWFLEDWKFSSNPFLQRNQYAFQHQFGWLEKTSLNVIILDCGWPDLMIRTHETYPILGHKVRFFHNLGRVYRMENLLTSSYGCVEILQNCFKINYTGVCFYFQFLDLLIPRILNSWIPIGTV